MPSLMEGMAASVFVVCLIAGIRSFYYVYQEKDDPKKWYVLAKGLVILYLGSMYGIVAVDYFWDIVKYPTQIQSTTGQMLRVAALITSVIFLTDSWIRNK